MERGIPKARRPRIPEPPNPGIPISDAPTDCITEAGSELLEDDVEPVVAVDGSVPDWIAAWSAF